MKKRQRAFGHHTVTRKAMPKRVPVWLAMRQLVRFDIPTLIVTTDAVRACVEVFVYKLKAAGYLRQQRCSNPAGRGGSVYVYHLVRNTGPLPPITRRNGDVYDQNEKKVYSPGAAKGEASGQDTA